MAKTFVTLFPPAGNTHLTKDVGQIPAAMHRFHGYHSQLVAYNNDHDYPALDTEAKGLELVFLNKAGKRYFLENAVIHYLEKHAAEIDVLNLYHLDRDTMYYGNLYKKLNPKGFLYCKLDLYNEFLVAGRKQHSINVFKNAVLRWWEKKFIRNTDLFSVENRQGLELMKRRYPACKNKIIYLPNGVNSAFIEGLFSTPAEKEPLILIMSRIGEGIKNHEVLLRVIPRLRLGNWKIAFVGPVVQRFAPKVAAFFQEFPHLRHSVEFVGPVTDRKEVYEWYRKSRVTCLTSRHESFGIALVEGLYFGNYLLGTDGMSSFNEISNQSRFGKALPVNNDDALLAALQAIIDRPEEVDLLRDEAMAYARRHFTWPVLVQQLEEAIQKQKLQGDAH
ncbi:MAG: glycosyltransferase [Cryomorphaceae bacterium]|nr:MAG: glycosyltransferase [Cryomorphaceae bacterium]